MYKVKSFQQLSHMVRHFEKELENVSLKTVKKHQEDFRQRARPFDELLKQEAEDFDAIRSKLDEAETAIKKAASELARLISDLSDIKQG